MKAVKSTPSYTDDSTSFVPTGGSGPRRYYHQHAYDLLLGIEVDGEPVYPHHLREGSATAAQRKNFACNVRNNYTLKEFDGRYELLHERKPGHRSSVSGERNSGFGWRLIPRKAEISDLVAMVSQNSHPLFTEMYVNAAVSPSLGLPAWTKREVLTSPVDDLAALTETHSPQHNGGVLDPTTLGAAERSHKGRNIFCWYHLCSERVVVRHVRSCWFPTHNGLVAKTLPTRQTMAPKVQWAMV